MAESILDSESCRQLLKAVAVRAALAEFPMIEASEIQEEIDWSFALRSASVLASAQIEDAQDAALRIAQTCLGAAAEAEEGHKRAAALILERMGNQPALRLADERDLVEGEAWEKAPVPLAFDVIRRRLELAIPSRTGRTLSVNQFQRDFWTAAHDARWVSVSAPTSAGKSYIVAAWFKEQIEAQENFRGVYIVPTRALIDEVSHELERIFAGGVPVFNIPWDEEIDSAAQEAYVFTQERMHFLQQRLPEFATTMLFVDEAQKFGDGERGVLLQRVVAEAVRRAPEGQVIFASPLSSNPELLLEGKPADAEGTPVRSEVITVNQNLLWVEEDPHEEKTWKVELVREGEPLELGDVELDARTTSVSKRLSLVAVALGRQHKGNLVYANRPSDAETIAKQIGEARRAEVDLSGHEEIVKLKELVEKTIHRRYRLIGALDAGVAFHYGNMPLLVRTKIEELFRDGVLSYLVCTSTLMEGVNLPSSNLFAMGPKKGQSTLMEPADFWNLAGRAGRWGKEFQGNIVCINPRDTHRWREPPMRRVRRPLSRASDQVLADTAALRAYIADGELEAEGEVAELAEPVFSYLASEISKDVPLRSLPGTAGIATEELAELELEISEVLEEVEIPAEIYRAHAGINPVAMQRLLIYFRKHEEPANLPLLLPEKDGAAESYLKALTRVRNHLGAPLSPSGGYLHAQAILIREWMRGRPLPVLISKRIDYEKKTNPGKNEDTLVAAAIRNTMRDVEQFVRFQAPKYLTCYADILEFHLLESKSEVKMPEMDLSMMLEMGVARTSELSMMTLGLSRASAIALEKYVVPDELTRDECISWLTEQNLDALDVPALVREEIARVVENLGDEQEQAPEDQSASQ
jgi:hypothetical protein